MERRRLPARRDPRNSHGNLQIGLLRRMRPFREFMPRPAAAAAWDQPAVTSCVAQPAAAEQGTSIIQAKSRDFSWSFAPASAVLLEFAYIL